eukprot:TRINITY_DN46700_c0_g1_i1.p1 TRINITY_DN46700_c0_g1~~TRINITY_DN46700_c0_g1_i1.p1  ORF type:complete len:238 (+),score=25.99 TRINITY_DN46700_c0_g1_i1:72-785(+)
MGVRSSRESPVCSIAIELGRLDVSEIVFGKLYLGGETALSAPQLLAKHLSAVIVVLPSPAGSNEVEQCVARLRHEGLAVLHLALRDDGRELLGQHFEAAYHFLADCPGLVLCSAGMSRSATIVTALLMQARSWSAKRAFEHVRSCRPCVMPNVGFVQQLLDFEIQRGGPQSGSWLAEYVHDCYLGEERRGNCVTIEALDAALRAHGRNVAEALLAVVDPVAATREASNAATVAKGTS